MNSEHPARLLDREDSRHYSGFLSSTEELSMDVPDLLASLLELGEDPLQHTRAPPPSSLLCHLLFNHMDHGSALGIRELREDSGCVCQAGSRIRQQRAAGKPTLGAALEGQGRQGSGSQSSRCPHGARRSEIVTQRPGW